MAEPRAAEPVATEPVATAPIATAAAPAPGGLEAEPDDWDGDSAVGEENIAGSTASISSSILRYREENGRTYHAYKVILLVNCKLRRH
jgi:hypothetical protein